MKKWILPDLIVPSCLSTYVLKMTYFIWILLFFRVFAMRLNNAAPSRLEMWLKMRIRMSGAVPLYNSAYGQVL